MSTATISSSPLRPDILLQAEAALALLACCFGVHCAYPHHWVWFALLFFVPDLSLLAYAFRSWKHATASYNLAHNYALPTCLGVFAWAGTIPLAGFLSLVWLAHISLDRMLGYGLKFPGLFKYTHIQRSRSATGIPQLEQGSHLPHNIG